jgi:DNA polymerase III subunit epsilon
MLDRFGKLIFIDLETTGPNPSIDFITEIGIVEVSAAGVERWSTLVNPQVPIPPFIQRLTGIDDEMVRDAPTFAQVQEEVQRRLQDGLFIAHNARFDYGFLRNAYKRFDINLRCEVLCTVKLSRKLFPTEFKHSLDALVARHSLKCDARHRALADADLLWQFWRKIEAGVPRLSLHNAVNQLLQRPRIPAALEPEQLDDLPDGPGVYAFFGEHDVPLHVGRGAHLRQRVLSHFPADHASYKDAHLAREIRRLEWHETVGEVGAQLMQIQMTRALRPVHDKVPEEQEVFGWQLQRTEAGHLRAVLVSASELDFNHAPQLYGLFQSRQKAEAALRALVDKNALCAAATGLESLPAGAPCSLREHHLCLGACVGMETMERHALRLENTLAGIKLQAWPYAGPVAMIETGSDGRPAVHLIHNWAYLGSAEVEHELWHLLDEARGQPAFDADVYKVLQRALAKDLLQVRPLSGPGAGERRA